MALSPAQFGVLTTLRMFGAKTACEVILPPGMDGTRKTRLEWNVATGATLSKLEAAGFVSVTRKPAPTLKNAVGKKGHPRRLLTIEITPKGLAALADDEAN